MLCLARRPSERPTVEKRSGDPAETQSRRGRTHVRTSKRSGDRERRSLSPRAARRQADIAQSQTARAPSAAVARIAREGSKASAGSEMDEEEADEADEVEEERA